MVKIDIYKYLILWFVGFIVLIVLLEKVFFRKDEGDCERIKWIS